MMVAKCAWKVEAVRRRREVPGVSYENVGLVE